MRRFFKILFWVLFLAGIGAGLVLVEMQHENTVCKGFTLGIMDNNQDPLIGEAELRQEILSITDTLTGKKLKDIDLMQINSILSDNPYVLRADIQTNISGYLDIEIELRKAIMLVINKDGVSYYLDEDGYLLPKNEGYPSRVVIANGYISDGLSKIGRKKIHFSELSKPNRVKELYAMASYIDRSGFLKRMISQVWVNKKGSYELIPLVGNYTARFGTIDEMAAKFEKLETFYREGAGKAGWIDYRSVDLRYKNQIICSKK